MTCERSQWFPWRGYKSEIIAQCLVSYVVYMLILDELLIERNDKILEA
jgi:hypothetical protein